MGNNASLGGSRSILALVQVGRDAGRVREELGNLRGLHIETHSTSEPHFASQARQVHRDITRAARCPRQVAYLDYRYGSLGGDTSHVPPLIFVQHHIPHHHATACWDNLNKLLDIHQYLSDNAFSLSKSVLSF